MEVNLRPLTLKDFLGMIRRQKGWVITILLGCIALGFAAVELTTPVFETKTSILVEQGSSGSNNQSDPVAIMELPTPMLAIPTQIQLIQSPMMVDKAYITAGINKQSLGKREPRVRVHSVNDTNILEIAVESTDPFLASQIAATLPDEYAKYVMDNRQEVVQKSISATMDKIAEQKEQLADDEEKLREYRKRHGLLPIPGKIDRRSLRVEDAELAVEKAKTSVAIIQRQIDALEDEKRKELARKNTGAMQENTAAIEGVKGEIANLEAERSVLLKDFLEDHPNVVALDTRIAERKRYLKSLPRFISVDTSQKNPNIDGYNSQLATARVQMQVAQKELSEAQAQLARSKSSLDTYEDVESEESTLVQAVEGKKANIENLQATLRIFQIKHQSAKNLVSLVALPSTPQQVKPRDVQYLGIAILMGAFIAIGFAMLKDSIEDTVTSTEEIYSLTGLPSLGNVPSLPGNKGGAAIAPLNSRLIENFRVLRFNLLFSTLESPPKSIVVTSSGPGEGKTDFACNLAVAASGEGRRVILIDGNLRYPMIHKKMNIAGKPGLSDVVLGHATLDESLHPTAVPGLFVLTCGTQVQSPAELFASPAMGAFMRKLSGSSDLIIVDAPNCMSGAEALVLSNVAEAVLYVAKAGSTKRVAIRRGLDALRQANARVLGVAMNGAA